METLNQNSPIQSEPIVQPSAQPQISPEINNSKSNQLISPFNLILLGLIGIIIYLVIQNRQLSQSPIVTDYDSCVAAPGSLLQTSYPATCVTKSGQSFKEPIDKGLEPEPFNPINIEPNLPPAETLPGTSPGSSGGTEQNLIEPTNNSSSYTSSRVVSWFDPFSLILPNNWQTKSEVNVASDDSGSLILTLTKSGAKIVIGQGAMDAGSCLYPEDQIKDGMYAKYGQYTEIKKANFRWRIAQRLDSTPTSYVVCEYKPETKEFAGMTQIGSIMLELSKDNKTALTEFTQMIQNLKILP